MASKNPKKSKKIVGEYDQHDSGILSKRDEIEFPKPSVWEEQQDQHSSLKKVSMKNKQTKMSISEIKQMIKNPKQFMWLYGVELGYHLPPRVYVTWPYIISILQGTRKMIKASKISISISVPKLEQLSMKRIWPRFRNDAKIVRFMPLIGEERYPPRNFFFEVLHTKFRKIFDKLVAEAKQERQEELERQNLVITVDQTVFEEISRCSVWTDMSQSRISKRVCTTRTTKSRNRFT